MHGMPPGRKSVSHSFKALFQAVKAVGREDGLPCKSFGPPALPQLPKTFGGKAVCRIFTLWEYPADRGDL